MPDRNDDDNETPERPARATPEGVRILGAEEAQAVLEGGQVARRRGDDDLLRYGDVPARPEPPSRPTVRFPLTEGTSAGAHEDEAAEVEAEPEPEPGETPPSSELTGSRSGETSGAVQLPHWTEPPTGEILQILPEAEAVDLTGEDDLEAWQGISGSAPRFRSGAADWDEGDFAIGESLKDEESDVGALSSREPERDDDASFEEAVAARRRRGTRRISATAGEPATAAAAGATAAGAEGATATEASEEEGPTAGAPARPGAAAASAARPRPRRRMGLEPDAQPVPTGRSAAPPTTMGQRVVTGVGIAAVALLCLALGPRTATALVMVVVTLGVIELYTALQQHGYHPATLVGVVGSFGLVLAAYNYGIDAYPLVIVLVVMFTMFWYLFDVVSARPTVNFGMTMVGFGYIGVLAGFAGLMLQARPSNNGVGLLLGAAICAVAYDIGGYLVGSQFGRNHFMPKISPNKTVEGLIGGMAASVVFGIVVVAVLRISPWDMSSHSKLLVGFALGLVVAVVAPLGDLCESMLKRDLGVKDLGTIFPGHGGVLDRFDAILFALPAVYYLARWLKIG